MPKFDLSGESFGMGNRQSFRGPDAKMLIGKQMVDEDVDHGLSVKVNKTLPEVRKGGNQPFQGVLGNSKGSGVKTAQRANSGASGAKMQITSIRFTPENHLYVRQEASMRGMSVIDFVNWIVDEYKSKPGNVHNSGVYKDQASW